eukprot:scaffold28455_cov60-Phaeocystis_antarctica.AAC.3
MTTGATTGATTGSTTGATTGTKATTAPAAADAAVGSSRLGLAALGVRGSRALLGVSLKFATSTEWKPFSAESGT